MTCPHKSGEKIKSCIHWAGNSCAAPSIEAIAKADCPALDPGIKDAPKKKP